jgi:hypothetical protein
MMKGMLILIVFFSLFTSASLIISSPLFPGNVLCALIGSAISQYTNYLSAVFNGLFYGAILWLVFMVISRKFEEQK